MTRGEVSLECRTAQLHLVAVAQNAIDEVRLSAGCDALQRGDILLHCYHSGAG